MKITTTYKGWIPVASGFLSFSNIKGQIIQGRCYDEPSIEGRVDSPDGCVVKSRRYLIDRPLAPFRSRFHSCDERYDFECSMKLVGDQLVGKVIAHPAIEEKPAISIKRDKNLLPGVYKVCLGWVVGFELQRNGTVTLDWGALAPGDVAQIVDLEDGWVSEEQAELMLTFEIFSFLKDLIHNHKFHSVDDDSIVVPFKVADTSDASWQDETAKNMHRAIVSSLRNDPGQIELANSLGKICYLKTFLSFSSTNFCIDLAKSLPNLEHAVEIRLQTKSIKASARDFISTTWVAVTLALFATGLPLIQLLQMPCIVGLSDAVECSRKFQVPPLAMVAAEFLLKYWTEVALISFGVLLLIGYIAVRPSVLNVYTHRAGNERWDWQFVRFFYGLALTQGKYMALMWLTLLFGFVVALIVFSVVQFLR